VGRPRLRGRYVEGRKARGPPKLPAVAMADRVDPEGRIRGALAQRLVQVINEDPWHTPDVAAEIGAEAIPILLDVETRDDVHPPPGIDVRDWLDMQTEGLARAGEANLDRFISEVTARKAQDRLIVLWAIGMMREIPAGRVAPILLEAMRASVGYHREFARWASIDAFAVHRHPSAVEPIIAALKDPDDMVRFAAVRALRAYKDPRALEPLRAYATNAENRSRSPGGVAEALNAIGEIAPE